MSITVKDDDRPPRELIPAGQYIARCYSMINFGTIEEEYMGKIKMLNKVRLSWEIPELMRQFKEGEPEQPMAIHNDYTLSLYEKANLRADLESWRGQAFKDDETDGFDITKVLGVECFMSIIHKTSKKGNDYEIISSITPVPDAIKKGVKPLINKLQELSYENWDQEVFDAQPKWIQEKIESSNEYKEMKGLIPPDEKEEVAARKEAYDKAFNNGGEPTDDLPF